MNLDTYTLSASPDFQSFKFYSVGPNGSIPKAVQFQTILGTDYFNLAFGDLDPASGELDDLAKSNNGDSEKVLATVVTALYSFLKKYPNATVYAKGSTPVRTRLYRMGIFKYYNKANSDISVYGELELEFEPFCSGQDYLGFLVRKKFN
ncbi:DUF6934 family protein [Dyadobacter sandarakinus]|uniref:Uncharacterized protein n=1 Tax=Dyadobacter sandarakinus TaxID=2747268 RepID=A0ABX7ICA6_9BACT|nr:hypothetical protein [Dyadobacter sandarakinus]QRR03555.1 hypothetical protein HWI92_22890 [Dyadobacter sandarakinus]